MQLQAFRKDNQAYYYVSLLLILSNRREYSPDARSQDGAVMQQCSGNRPK